MVSKTAAKIKALRRSEGKTRSSGRANPPTLLIVGQLTVDRP
jgi:hypothetical protein